MSNYHVLARKRKINSVACGKQYNIIVLIRQNIRASIVVRGLAVTFAPPLTTRSPADVATSDEALVTELDAAGLPPPAARAAVAAVVAVSTRANRSGAAASQNLERGCCHPDGHFGSVPQ